MQQIFMYEIGVIDAWSPRKPQQQGRKVEKLKDFMDYY
jgi:hypothetical protein